MNIYILPKYQCLEIAKKNLREPYQSDEHLLRYLPDGIFNRTLAVKQEYSDRYKVDGVLGAFWYIPKEFAKPVPDAIAVSLTTEVPSMDSITYSTNIGYTLNPVSPISNVFTIGRDPWIMKINLETGIIEVNPIVIDKQTDDIVKGVLCALNGAMLEEWRRFYGKQQDVPEM